MAKLLRSKRNYRNRWFEARDRLRQDLRLARALPAYLSQRVTVEMAEEEIKKALETRGERFLELVRSQVYARPDSPYRKLLEIAGCEFADLQAHVRRDGLDKTLERLAAQGVYLTSDEFKGKKEVVRGRQSFRVSPDDFQRQDLPPGIVTQSSGTSNRPLRSLRPLDWHAIGTSGMAVYFSAHNLFSYSHANYDSILPGAAVNSLLHQAKLGIRTERWFARKMFLHSRLGAAHYYLLTYLIVLMGKWYGPGFPRPEFLDFRDLHRIVLWIAEKRREGKLCCVNAAASNAVRIAQAAWSRGISLEGTKFRVHGEPVTEAKRVAIERVGASTICRYNGGMSLGGGYGCADPLYTDEVHASEYSLALIPRPEPVNRDVPPIRPLLFTTLYASAPRLFLNVENGDYATLERRHCGCALERAGLTLHLHHIRSYEKFTSEGMNYFYGDLYDFFEKTLPAEFGGGPGDYQLVEEEDERGQTRLTLRVHPDVPIQNESGLLGRLREELAKGSRGNEFQAKVWQDAGTFRIRREVPHSSPRGKILPLHIART
jgi:hypothetical protein